MRRKRKKKTYKKGAPTGSHAQDNSLPEFKFEYQCCGRWLCTWEEGGHAARGKTLAVSSLYEIQYNQKLRKISALAHQVLKLTSSPNSSIAGRRLNL